MHEFVSCILPKAASLYPQVSELLAGMADLHKALHDERYQSSQLEEKLQAAGAGRQRWDEERQDLRQQVTELKVSLILGRQDAMAAMRKMDDTHHCTVAAVLLHGFATWQ